MQYGLIVYVNEDGSTGIIVQPFEDMRITSDGLKQKYFDWEMLDYSDDRDYIKAQAYIIEFANKKISELKRKMFYFNWLRDMRRWAA